jgi:phosphoribosylaminoimidazolecarboxamide formyltransferase/IMP cyclohydrolase
VAAVEEHEIPAIDMVVVNLYAFEKTASKPGVKFEEIIENIDIGGPSMLRSAAKNFEDVAVVTSVADYPAIAEEMRANGGALRHKTRWRLARAAFATTAAYDAGIASTLELLPEEPGSLERNAEFPQTLRVSAERKTVLR